MKYYKTENVLPEELVNTIQNYIDGGYIYIPKKQNTHKSWGENSGTRSYHQKRNEAIFSAYLNGSKIAQLAEEYFLSASSIRRIISKEKKRSSLTQKHS